MSAWDHDRVRGALDTWVAATTNVIVETLRQLASDDGPHDDHADHARREYMAAAARLADALDTDDDTWTGELVAGHCQLMAGALELAAETLAAERDDMPVPLDRLAPDPDLARNAVAMQGQLDRMVAMARQALAKVTNTDDAERADLMHRRLLWLLEVVEGTTPVPATWTPRES